MQLCGVPKQTWNSVVAVQDVCDLAFVFICAAALVLIGKCFD